jgi:hypothetical protein
MKMFSKQCNPTQFAEVEKNASEMKNLCDICIESHEATMQCLDCGVQMCPEMSRVHCLQRIHQNHRVSTIEEAQTHLKVNPLPVVLMCRDHPGKAFEYFDETCEKLLCVTCALLGNHLGHTCK